MDSLSFSPTKTLVIHNPTSGRTASQKRALKVIQRLEAIGFHIVPTLGPDHAKKVSAGALRSEFESIICVGGDGTLFEIIEELPPSLPIGVYPAGTVNLLARSLSIPETPESWIALLNKGTVKQVYLGLANGRPFASVGSIGFDAQVVANVNPQLKRWFHEGAYGIQAVIELIPYRFPQYSVTIDGRKIDGDVLGVLIGKGPFYAGPHPILKLANHHMSTFCIGILEGNSKGHLLRYAWGLARGTLNEMKGVQLYSGNEITIESDPLSHVELDGEPYGTTPVRFSVEGKARRVLVP